ncbi:MAG: hypothetical protein R3293_18690 [Candidatus Promineifilaceae bacterium]|nr:hypothetical protein [Candidatus Promineifilaceae bacterium]
MSDSVLTITHSAIFNNETGGSAGRNGARVISALMRLRGRFIVFTCPRLISKMTHSLLILLTRADA